MERNARSNGRERGDGDPGEERVEGDVHHAREAAEEERHEQREEPREPGKGAERRGNGAGGALAGRDSTPPHGDALLAGNGSRHGVREAERRPDTCG